MFSSFFPFKFTMYPSGGSIPFQEQKVPYWGLLNKRNYTAYKILSPPASVWSLIALNTGSVGGTRADGSRPLCNVDPKTLLHGDDFCRFQLYFTRIAWKLKLFDTITCFKYTLKPKITPIRVIYFIFVMILKIKTNDICRVAFLVLLWQLMYG